MPGQGPTQLNEGFLTNYQEADRNPMTVGEIEAWLVIKIESSMGAPDGDVSERRQKNLDYYTGQPYGDERDGYSKVITMECFEAVQWALPSLVRMFMTGKFAAFIPDGEHDEEQCDQETDVVNNFVTNDTDFYEWCHAWCTDGMIYPNGYLKVYIDEARDMRTVHHENLTLEQLAVLEQDDSLFNGEITDGDSVTLPQLDPQTGQMVQVPTQLYNVKARYLEERNNIKVEAVPPEEVFVDNDLRCVDLDKAEFVCHHREITRSELVAMGFDRDMVWNLPTTRRLKHSSERTNRAKYHDEDPNYGDDFDAMRKIDLYECFAYLDVDDDGYAEYCRFLFAGKSELLEWGEWDYQPLIALSCYPQPHRHAGLSMVDVSRENQRINSVLKRQTLDNMYRVNRPRQIIGRGVNVEQAMNYVPHGIIEAVVVNQVTAENIPVMTQHIMPFMEFVRDELDRRTGITRLSAGLDADTLASSTMGAYLESLGQATQRLEMLARNFAETGFKKVALKIHHLLRTRQNPQLTTKLGKSWIHIDPRQWNPRHRMRARVGIGTGSAKEKLAASMQMMEAQGQARPFGLANERGMYKSLEDFTEALGKNDTESYFVDPQSPEYKQWAQQQEQQRQEALAAQAQPQQLAGMALKAEADEKLGRLELDGIKEQNRQAEATAKTMLEAEEKRQTRFLKAAEIELDHQVDIANVGLKASNVTPLNKGSTDAA